jgi:hypothetical protein
MVSALHDRLMTISGTELLDLPLRKLHVPEEVIQHEALARTDRRSGAD